MIKTYQFLIILFVIFMLALPIRILANNFEVNIDENQIIELKEIACNFIIRDDLIKEKYSKDKKSFQYNSIEKGFDKTIGEWYRLYFNDFIVKIDMKSQNILSVIYLSEDPQKVEIFDESNKAISESEILKKAVKVSLEDAYKIAIEYVNIHFEENILAGLKSSIKQLTRRGNFSVYYFAWSQELDESGVAYGTRRVEISVNSQSGRVNEFYLAQSAVNKQATITPDECRRIVLNRFNKFPNIVITRLTLVELKAHNSSSVIAWAVVFNTKILKV